MFCLGFGARPRSKHRFTRGQASFTSFKELKEEGIETEVMPWIDKQEN